MTDLSVMLNLINYAFVLFFGITTSLCLADISFRTQRKIYLLFYLAFGMGQFLFYLIFWRKQTLSILSAADSFATDPVDLFWTEKEYLCFHGSSFVCLSDVYPTKMDRHICIQLFRL